MNYEEICLLIPPYNCIAIISRWSTVKATIAKVIRLILVITDIAIARVSLFTCFRVIIDKVQDEA